MVRVICCSTDFYEPPLGHELPLDFKHTGVCATGLREATVIVCNWPATLEYHDIHQGDIGGIVPTAILRAACVKAGLPVPLER